MASGSAFDALVFDLDGTLIDSSQDLADAVNHALRTVGMAERPARDIVRHVGNGMRVLVSAVMGPVADETLEAGLAAFRAHYEAHCLVHTRLYDGVADTLSWLSGRFRLAVVTNKPAGFSRQILKGLGVLERFGSVVGGDTLPQRKPDPAPVLKALNDLSVAPARALMVGDGPQDMSAGRGAGARTCLVRFGFGHPDPSLTADFEVNRFAEIKEIVT